MIGKTISHYRIIEKLGSGGMSVVCKAEDTRLKRTVALKFLPEEISKNRYALIRFQREAQASLTLLVAGHTDSTNTEAYDLRLPQQRVEDIVSWLVAHGFGRSQRLAQEAQAVGQALNRRVERIAQWGGGEAMSRD
jgi:hypothetical protein